MKKALTSLTCFSLCSILSLPNYAEDALPPISDSWQLPPSTLTSPPLKRQRRPAQKSYAPLSRRAAILSAVDPKDIAVKPQVDEDCPLPTNSYNFTVGHREANGIGYTDGYTSLDLFFIFSSFRNLYPFFDLRGHLSNAGAPATNLGFGLRYLPDAVNAVFGVNGFFDFKQASHATFQQVGCGIEILGTQWRYTANGYFPIGSRDHIWNTDFSHFASHSALLKVKHEIAMAGVESSIARSIIQRGFYDLSAYLGGYYFEGRRGLKAPGGYAKLSSNLSRIFSVEVQTSYDTLFRWIFQGAAYAHIPLGKRVKVSNPRRSCYTRTSLAKNLTQPVSRFEMIVSHNKEELTEALDPRTSTPLSIQFVNNTAAAGGDGSFERPFRILKAAETNSTPGQMIYVFAGDETDTHMNEGINLASSQWLQGSYGSFAVLGPDSLVTVPSQTTNYPRITGKSSGTTTPAVELSDNNIVAALRLKGGTSSEPAIEGSSISGGTITGNYMLESQSDINLIDITGIWNISSNTSTSSLGLEILSDTDFTLNVISNTFFNSGTSNIAIKQELFSSSLLNIKNNQISGSQNGIVLEFNNNSIADIRCTLNTISNITASAAAINLDLEDSSIVTGFFGTNTVNVSSPGGIFIDTSGSTYSYFSFRNNNITSTNTNTTTGITLSSSNASITTAALINNTASATAPFYFQTADNSTIYLESPDSAADGVQAINNGQITTSGNIIYIPLTPQPRR